MSPSRVFDLSAYRPWHAQSYQPLASDSDAEKNDGESNSAPQRPLYRRRLVPIALSASVVILALLFFLRHTIPSSVSQCQQPTIRREWRTLDPTEQHAYLDAVNCLRAHPSRLGLNHTLYDDFPWVHSQIGEYSHESAAFLAWHRYFIHTYESALRDTCAYAGHLTYWDWTLDWQDVTRAPVWGPTAFGSSGEDGAGEKILHGHCVTDGPFANLQVGYLKSQWHPHCLTRGFASGPELANLSSWIRPSAIEGLLADDDYETFNLGLERAAHLAIPRSVRGDFLLFTAPAGEFLSVTKYYY